MKPNFESDSSNSDNASVWNLLSQRYNDLCRRVRIYANPQSKIALTCWLAYEAQNRKLPCVPFLRQSRLFRRKEQGRWAEHGCKVSDAAAWMWSRQAQITCSLETWCSKLYHIPELELYWLARFGPDNKYMRFTTNVYLIKVKFLTLGGMIKLIMDVPALNVRETWAHEYKMFVQHYAPSRCVQAPNELLHFPHLYMPSCEHTMRTDSHRYTWMFWSTESGVDMTSVYQFFKWQHKLFQRRIVRWMWSRVSTSFLKINYISITDVSQAPTPHRSPTF